MDTDILGGITSELHTILVLSGVTQLEDIQNLWSFRPDIIIDNIGELVE